MSICRLSTNQRVQATRVSTHAQMDDAYRLNGNAMAKMIVLICRMNAMQVDSRVQHRKHVHRIRSCVIIRTNAYPNSMDAMAIMIVAIIRMKTCIIVKIVNRHRVQQRSFNVTIIDVYPISGYAIRITIVAMDRTRSWNCAQIRHAVVHSSRARMVDAYPCIGCAMAIMIVMIIRTRMRVDVRQFIVDRTSCVVPVDVSVYR